MEEFPGLPARDFGFRPQGKAAPMAASKGAGVGAGLGLGIGSGGAMLSGTSNGRSNLRNSSSFLDDHDRFLGSIGTQKTKDRGGYNDGDVFRGPPKYASVAEGRNGAHSGSSFDYDSIFKDSSGKASSLPVFDKPVYDDDGGGGSFNGVPTAGLKSSTSGKYSDVFSFDSSSKQGGRYDDLLGKLGRMDPELKSSSSRKRSGEVPKRDDSYDELLGNFVKVETESKSSSSSGRRSGEVDRDMSGFDDLIPGFGGRSPSNDRPRVPSEASQPHQSTFPSSKSTSSVIEDPFVVFESNAAAPYASSGQFTASVEEIDKPSKSGSTKVDVSSASGVYDNMDPFASLTKSVPSVSSDMKNREKDRSPSRTIQNLTNLRKYAGRGSTETPTGRMTQNNSQKKTPVVDYHESHQTLFDIPTVSSDSHKAFSQNGSLPSYVNVNTNQSTSQVDVPPKSDDCYESANEVWITVAEVPLFTQPTSAPPPSRPPPARPAKGPRASKGSFSAANSKKVDEFSSFQNPSQSFPSPKTVPDSSRTLGVSSIEELEDFAMGRSQNNASEVGDVSSEEGVDTNSAAASAAAMKDAMDRAEAKFKYAREVREREIAKGARTRGAAQQEKDEKVMQDARERELREEQERIDHEQKQREREEKEREQRRLREIERERGRARQAVERATREARERAAAEARLKAERVAAEKANAARERAAVQRAQAEARERAAAVAKERAQRAAAEARERAQAETREKAAAATKAEAEECLREERAAAADRVNQQKNDIDIESFLNMGARPNGAPRSRTSSDPAFDVQFHNRPGPEGTHRSFTGTSSSIKKASSATNIVDDLSSIFGASPSSGEFEDVEGESEERRRGRLMRHQKAEERAAKALAEKNERDLQAQREQAERHRMAETLDIEIKRWAAGKEGNLRALLSTLQYVLWPESGWQPVSLTDLITAASVKKVYRKATLCIHPDKVQQKGANLQQKCIAEKVFDLLKEAWNKLNSEELF